MSLPHDDWYQQIKQLVDGLFPDPQGIRLAVSAERQWKQLAQLEINRQPEEFFCVIDLLALEITASGGLHEMGWPSRMTLREYVGRFPQTGSFQMIGLMARQTLKLAQLTKNLFLTPKFITLLPVRHANGSILLVKRVTSPWQTTEDGMVTAYLNEFTIVKAYEGEAMHPRFVGIPPELEESFYQTIRQAFANMPTNRNPFAPKEMDLLRLYVAHPTHSTRAIAGMGRITELTLKDYNKTILRKAREFFGEKTTFRSARDVAEFMRHSQLISLD